MNIPRIEEEKVTPKKTKIIQLIQVKSWKS